MARAKKKGQHPFRKPEKILSKEQAPDSTMPKNVCHAVKPDIALNHGKKEHDVGQLRPTPLPETTVVTKCEQMFDTISDVLVAVLDGGAQSLASRTKRNKR